MSLSEFLALRDQDKGPKLDISSTQSPNVYIHDKRRSSAVSGIRVLVLE
jgi:hypothetical protein